MKDKKLFLVLFFLALTLFVLDKMGFLGSLIGQIEQKINPLKSKIYTLSIKPREFVVGLKVKAKVFEDFKKKERELESCQYEAQSLKKENQDLRFLLQAPLPKSWAFLPAKVLGKRRYLVLDKGEKDGVYQGMIAVFENFLVGKVVKTTRLSSSVILPFDSESHIAVKTEKGVIGLLEGRFGTKLFLTSVLQKEILQVGSLVVTTGEGDYFGGLLIGKVKSESKESEESFKEVEVEPGLDYGSLTAVFLVKER